MIKKIKFTTGLVRNRFANIDIFRSLQAFWCQLEGPRDDEGNGKTNHNQHYHEADGPIRNLEERENLRRYLHQQPRDDCIGDRNFVNIAPPQFGEEVFRVHSARLHEALVTAALYLDARHLKSAQRPKTGVEDGQPHQRPTIALTLELSVRFAKRNSETGLAQLANFCQLLQTQAGAA